MSKEKVSRAMQMVKDGGSCYAVPSESCVCPNSIKKFCLTADMSYKALPLYAQIVNHKCLKYLMEKKNYYIVSVNGYKEFKKVKRSAEDIHPRTEIEKLAEDLASSEEKTCNCACKGEHK